MTDASVMIQAEKLCKTYGSFNAIKDVSFSIPRGQVAAFLGPNGAGKTTTMKILTGFLSSSSGTARIAGFDVSTDRLLAAEKLGYLPENGPLYLDMTPFALLVVALATTLVLLGYAVGLRDEPPPTSGQPPE